jgi:chorismate mutase/prephenate dehydratase
LIIGRQETGPSGEDKTSIMVSNRHQPGSLYQVLAPFHEAGVNLTRIETRPDPSGTWNYIFFIDFEGHCEDDAASAVLKKLQDIAVDYKVLGSYPRAVL